MAGVTATAGSRRLPPWDLTRVTAIIDQSPGTIERGRPQIIVVPPYRIAGGVADATIDALDAGVGGNALWFVRPDRLDRVVTGFRWFEDPFGRLPFLKKRLHVRREILDHRQVRQRSNFKRSAVVNLGNMGTTGPARTPIHGHCT